MKDRGHQIGFRKNKTHFRCKGTDGLKGWNKDIS